MSHRVITYPGPPTSDTGEVGDDCTDSLGVEWTCTASGSPGTWVSADTSATGHTGRFDVTTYGAGFDGITVDDAAWTAALAAAAAYQAAHSGATAAISFSGNTVVSPGVIVLPSNTTLILRGTVSVNTASASASALVSTTSGATGVRILGPVVLDGKQPITYATGTGTGAANQTLTLPTAPASASLVVRVANVPYDLVASAPTGNQYTLSGNVITFGGAAPGSGAAIAAAYQASTVPTTLWGGVLLYGVGTSDSSGGLFGAEIDDIEMRDFSNTCLLTYLGQNIRIGSLRVRDCASQTASAAINLSSTHVTVDSIVATGLTRQQLLAMTGDYCTLGSIRATSNNFATGYGVYLALGGADFACDSVTVDGINVGVYGAGAGGGSGVNNEFIATSGGRFSSVAVTNCHTYTAGNDGVGIAISSGAAIANSVPEATVFGSLVVDNIASAGPAGSGGVSLVSAANVTIGALVTNNLTDFGVNMQGASNVTINSWQADRCGVYTLECQGTSVNSNIQIRNVVTTQGCYLYAGTPAYLINMKDSVIAGVVSTDIPSASQPVFEFAAQCSNITLSDATYDGTAAANTPNYWLDVIAGASNVHIDRFTGLGSVTTAAYTDAGTGTTINWASNTSQDTVLGSDVALTANAQTVLATLLLGPGKWRVTGFATVGASTTAGGVALALIASGGAASSAIGSIQGLVPSTTQDIGLSCAGIVKLTAAATAYELVAFAATGTSGMSAKHLTPLNSYAGATGIVAEQVL